MKLKFFAALGALLAIETAAHGQMTTLRMGGPDPIHVAASAVYGFKLKETGVSVEGGKYISPGNFVGLEATYFRVREDDSYLGAPVYSREHLTTILALYRFTWSMPSVPELSLYAGAGAGVGIVRLSTDFPALLFHTSDRNNSFAGEIQAGGMWMLNKSWGLKAGYRRFEVFHVKLFGSRSSITDDLIEGGVTFKF